MSPSRPPHSVPTLTEVVTWPPVDTAAERPADAADRPAETTPASAAPQAGSTAPAATPGAIQLPDEAELRQRVLADLQRQVDLMLEVRLREALAPLLARATDALVRDARNELAATLREMVTRAVAQELARQRGP